LIRGEVVGDQYCWLSLLLCVLILFCVQKADGMTYHITFFAFHINSWSHSYAFQVAWSSV